MILANLPGPVLFLVSLGVMFLFVPGDRIRNLFTFGVVGGFFGALTLLYFMTTFVPLWTFYRADMVYHSRIPVLLAASWAPIVIIFAHMLMTSLSLQQAVATLLLFPLGATLLQYLLRLNGMLVFDNWNLTLTFLLSLTVHLGLALYLYLSNRLHRVEELPER